MGRARNEVERSKGELPETGSVRMGALVMLLVGGVMTRGSISLARAAFGFDFFRCCHVKAEPSEEGGISQSSLVVVRKDKTGGLTTSRMEATDLALPWREEPLGFSDEG